MDDKRTRIQQKALTLFITHGFHGTPTSLIAKEAGVATGTLFHYFQSKEELINSLYIECKESFLRSLESGLDKNREIKDIFKHFFLNLIQWGLDHREQFLFYQQFRSSSFITDYTKEQVLAKFQFFVDLVERAKKQKLIKDLPMELLLDILEGQKVSMIYHFLENQEKLKDEKYVNDAFELLWDGIKR